MKSAGILLLGVWLVAQGLISLIGLSFNGMHMIMGALAVVAGVLIILRR
jgi:hypothetical protein